MIIYKPMECTDTGTNFASCGKRIKKNWIFNAQIFQIINGHKVVINETEYKQQDENGGAFFKVRIIDVKPEPGSTEATTEAANAAVDDVEPLPTTSTSRDVESAEDTLENEISKSKEVEVGRNSNTPEKLKAAWDCMRFYNSFLE